MPLTNRFLIFFPSIFSCFQVCIIQTVREKDGLAMSSRNQYLTETDRKHALTLYKAITSVKNMYDAGERDATVC